MDALPQTPKRSDPLFMKLSPFNATNHVDPTLLLHEFMSSPSSLSGPPPASPLFLTASQTPRQSFTDIMKSSPLYPAYHSSPVRGASPSQTPVLMPLLRSSSRVKYLDGLSRKLDFEALAGKKHLRRRVAQKDCRLSPDRFRHLPGVTSSPARTLLISPDKMNLEFKRGIMGGNDENRTPRKKTDMAAMLSTFPATNSAKKRRLDTTAHNPQRRISLSVNEDGHAVIDMAGASPVAPPREKFGGLLSKKVLSDLPSSSNELMVDSRYESSDEDDEGELKPTAPVTTPMSKHALVRQRMAQLLASASARSQVRSSALSSSSPVSTVSSLMDRPPLTSSPVSMYSGMSSSPSRKRKRAGGATSTELEALFPALTPGRTMISHHDDSEGETDIEDHAPTASALGGAASTASMDAREALRAAISFKSYHRSSSTKQDRSFAMSVSTPVAASKHQSMPMMSTVSSSPLRFTADFSSPARATKLCMSPFRSSMGSGQVPSTPTFSGELNMDDMLQGWDSPSTVWGERT